MTTQTDSLPAAPEQAVLPATRIPWARVVAAFAFGFVAAAALGAGLLVALDQAYAGRIVPGVRVGTVDLSGLSPDDARAALTEAFAGYGQGVVVVQTSSGPQEIGFAEVGRGPDADTLVAEALAVGHTGSAVERTLDGIRSFLRGTRIDPQVRLDPARVAERVAAIAATTDVPALSATAAIFADGSRVTPAVAGSGLDQEAAAAEILAALSDSAAPPRITVNGYYSPVAPVVSDADRPSGPGGRAAGDRAHHAGAREGQLDDRHQDRAQLGDDRTTTRR